MKLSAPLSVLLVGLLASSCGSLHHKTPKPDGGGPSTIVTPDSSITATVVSCNSVGRFVVLRFPVGQMPKLGQNLFLYRNGLKAGEVKIDTWQRDNLVVADIVNGDAQVGDEARDQ
jgi:hypothetical protein